MADSKVQQEPSIEEILSSIRQIINEEDDTQVSASTAEQAPPKPSHMADNDDDVLDLASIAKPKDMPAPTPAPAPAPVVAAPPPPPPAPKIDFDAEEEGPDIEMETHVEPTPAPKPAAPKVDEGLISSKVADAAVASLTKLAQAEVMIDHKHAAGLGSVTLEDVVKEMLRPMVKSWMDENLPPLVEKLVQREIEKIGKRV